MKLMGGGYEMDVRGGMKWMGGGGYEMDGGGHVKLMGG